MHAHHCDPNSKILKENRKNQSVAKIKQDKDSTRTISGQNLFWTTLSLYTSQKQKPKKLDWMKTTAIIQNSNVLAPSCSEASHFSINGQWSTSLMSGSFPEPHLISRLRHYIFIMVHWAAAKQTQGRSSQRLICGLWIWIANARTPL